MSRFQHDAFDATVPGDASSAEFLVGAAALTGSELTVRGVGLNPNRLRFLDVFSRMGVEVAIRVESEELGEPVGELHVRPGAELRAVRVEPDELPLVHDEVPVLALVASHAPGDSRWRDEHLPQVSVPTLFCSGTNDAFATPDELQTAAAKVPVWGVAVATVAGRFRREGVDVSKALHPRRSNRRSTRR